MNFKSVNATRQKKLCNLLKDTSFLSFFYLEEKEILVDSDKGFLLFIMACKC